LLKIIQWTRVKDELTVQVDVILLKLVKAKEVLVSNGGGKLGKGVHFTFHF